MLDFLQCRDQMQEDGNWWLRSHGRTQLMAIFRPGQGSAGDVHTIWSIPWNCAFVDTDTTQFGFI
jgi:hypothetical protein